jgi:hypothetical protein
MNCYAPIQNDNGRLFWRSKENGGWSWKDVFIEKIDGTPGNMLSIKWKQKLPHCQNSSKIQSTNCKIDTSWQIYA